MSFFGDVFARLTGHEEDYDENAVLLDVRSPGEHVGGIIEGSLPLPNNMVMGAIEGLVPDKQTPIIVYCASGMRSAGVKNQLNTLGYHNVINGMSIGHVAQKTQTKIVKPH